MSELQCCITRYRDARGNYVLENRIECEQNSRMMYGNAARETGKNSSTTVSALWICLFAFSEHCVLIPFMMREHQKAGRRNEREAETKLVNVRLRLHQSFDAGRAMCSRLEDKIGAGYRS